MAFFGPDVDLEVGELPAQSWPGRMQPIAPITLRRGQASQRFVVGMPVTIRNDISITLSGLISQRRLQLQTFSTVNLLITGAYACAGVVLLLFLAGLVPFSSVLFLLLALLALASCLQYNAVVRQQAEQRSNSGSSLHQERRTADSFHQAAVLSMMGTFGLNSAALNNLRLAMLDRDFNDAGKNAASCTSFQP